MFNFKYRCDFTLSAIISGFIVGIVTLLQQIKNITQLSDAFDGQSAFIRLLYNIKFSIKKTIVSHRCEKIHPTGG